MTKYRALLHYAGTRYSGWQAQKNQTTVQGEIQQALERICRERVSVVASGRTDAGVHARGQTAHFRLSESMPADLLLRALNGVLPGDIRVMRLGLAADDFHAQKQALKKRYEYRIYNGPVLSPFLRGFVLHVRAKLDFDAMAEAAALLPGRRDFKAFAAASSSVVDFHRRVFLSRMIRRGRLWTYRIEGDGFLRHMVRNIVGTLLEAGRGRLSPQRITEILASRDRRRAGPTAPPEGLMLTKVWY